MAAAAAAAGSGAEAAGKAEQLQVRPEDGCTLYYSIQQRKECLR